MAGQAIDTEADPFLTLLTDALRAGPGSRAWTEAIEQVRSRAAASDAKNGADEYALLLSARESLASGKDYRKVHAGTGFTRRLFSDLDSEPGGGKATTRALPIASIIAVLAAIGILAVIVLVIMQMLPKTGKIQAQADELAGAYYATDITSAAFDKPDSSIPMSFRAIGSLQLATGDGLHATPTTQPAGGGIVVSEPLPTDQPVAIEVDLRDPAPTDKTVLQIFVSANSDFSADRGAGSRELVYQLRGKTQQVYLEGGALTPGVAIGPGEQRVRIVLNHDLAVIETGSKQRLWAGLHHLGEPGPRYVGVRFIRAVDGSPANATNDGPVVTGIRIARK